MPTTMLCLIATMVSLNIQFTYLSVFISLLYSKTENSTFCVQLQRYQFLPRMMFILSLYYKYFYGKCSSEVVDLVPPKHVTVRSTRVSDQMYRHTFNSPMYRTKFYQSSFFPHTAALWNSLTIECFPPDYDLIAFKGRVNKFLLLK